MNIGRLRTRKAARTAAHKEHYELAGVHVEITMKDPTPDAVELADATARYIERLFDISIKYKQPVLDVIMEALQMQVDFTENTFPIVKGVQPDD